MKKRTFIQVFSLIVVFLFLSGCGEKEKKEPPTREEKIPSGAVKMTPGDDNFAPVLHLNEWGDPVPLPGPINTAGAEDSPFITPDGMNFYFFFTPDVNVPPEKQIIDGVTGIWWSKYDGDGWGEPVRVVLNDDVSLDGAVFILGNTMWFASVRVGNYGEVDIYTAKLKNGRWGDVKNAGKQLNEDYDVGELHITSDGSTMYCGRSDGDIWVLQKTGEGWSEPVRVEGINSERREDQPFITPDGTEMWFTGQSRMGYTGPAIFRSVWNGSGWGEPQEVISNFAGEPTLDSQGNIYFVHHYYTKDMKMIEADIYVAYHK